MSDDAKATACLTIGLFLNIVAIILALISKLG